MAINPLTTVYLYGKVWTWQRTSYTRNHTLMLIKDRGAPPGFAAKHAPVLFHNPEQEAI